MKQNRRKAAVRATIAMSVFVLLLIFSVLWVIKSTQDAVRVTDSLSEVAEDQTNKTPVEPTEPKPPETVVESTVSTTPSAVAYPVDITVDEAASDTVVVNKKHRLSSYYQPPLVDVKGGRLRPSAASELERLFQDAEATGYSPQLVSSFRSYATQEQVYGGFVERDGQEIADTYSARPGHSEHQTGLAADVDDGGGCQLEICFGKTGLGIWLATNAQNYGFIVRYPEGKEGITGYQYEPWHLRYVGPDAASIFQSGKTMDEFYGVEAGGYN